MQLHRHRVVVFMFVILAGVCHSSETKGETSSGPFYPGAFRGLHTQPESIVRDLQDFLPAYMNTKQIPGCAVSLVVDHRIAWSGGFGYLNSLTRKAVEGETVFEVASNSKILTSCVALLLADQGILALDTPLNDYLSSPWLPDTAYRDEITLRHVLTHTSGLGHNDMSPKVRFPPGSAYHYSNLGYTYLQHVLEELSGRSLEELAAALVFEPMGMQSTSYINKNDLRSRLANGHVPGNYLLGLSGVFFLVSLLLTWVPGIIIHRFARKRWLPGKRTRIRGILLTVFLWLVIVFVFFGMVGWFKYAWMIVLFGTVFLGLVLLMYLAGRVLFRRSWMVSGRRIKILLPVWALVVACGLVWITSSIPNIPVPRWPAIRAMAPASLRTTATDMATFLLEISKPGAAGVPVAEQMLDPQVRLHPEISWGLGMGIFHSPQGDALWQWGQNVDFQSLVIFWPEQGSGMVVLTNSQWGEPDVAMEIAGHALGVNLESIIRASHLEFSGELSPGSAAED